VRAPTGEADALAGADERAEPVGLLVDLSDQPDGVWLGGGSCREALVKKPTVATEGRRPLTAGSRSRHGPCP
jgi:hypothetical protein